MFRTDLSRAAGAALLSLILLACAGSAVSAREAVKEHGYEGSLGLFVNDALGDGRDRWQSASYQRSFFLDGAKKGETTELRARAQIVSPWTPAHQKRPDRPYSTVLGFGFFQHGTGRALDYRWGGEVLLQGDVTGLPRFQSFAHELLGLENGYEPSGDDPHVPGRLTAQAELELGRRVDLGDNAMLRSYGLVVAGADRKAVLGADLVLGAGVRAERSTRDVVTGQLLVDGDFEGFSLIAGADVSMVQTSMHIPQDSAVSPEPIQTRLRLGLDGQVGRMRFFAGQGWLGPQFSGQAEAQRVGMLSMRLEF